MSQTNNNQIISVIKEWITPFLLTTLGAILYQDIKDLKSDVKLLLSQQSADEVRIKIIEKEIDKLRTERIAPSQMSSFQSSIGDAKLEDYLKVTTDGKK